MQSLFYHFQSLSGICPGDSLSLCNGAVLEGIHLGTGLTLTMYVEVSNNGAPIFLFLHRTHYYGSSSEIKIPQFA